MKNIYDIIMSDKETKESMAMSEYLLAKDQKVDFLSTNVISLNLLFSGRVKGGVPIGRMSMISAPSKQGKSFIGLVLVKNAQKMGMQVVYIDTEYTFDYDWASSIGIDTSKEKLVVIQENNIDEVKTIIAKISSQYPKKERKNIFFVIDSWGAMVTTKTLEDAIEGKAVADMTEAKKLNSLAKVILNTQTTTFIVNHVYTNTGGGGGDPLAIPGGTKVLYLCSSCVIAKSRATEKDSDDEVEGFICTAETFKSRFSKEKFTKLKYRINLDGGLDTFYGLLPDALEGGYIVKPSQGWYTRPHVKDDKKFREKEIYNKEFWGTIFKDTDFKKFLENKYQFTNEYDVVKNESILEEIETIED